MKKVLSYLLTILFVVSFFAPLTSDATSIFPTGDHTYRGWSSVAEGYLEKTDTGYMYVTADREEAQVDVFYFDESFNLISSKAVQVGDELFGGFYSDGNNYYILTGNTNNNESSTVEVLVLNKFDKNWNTLGRAAATDCGVYSPFEFGSADMVAENGILYVEAARLMYKSGDGLHHQANVSVAFNTDTMEYIRGRSLYDYSSHCFNQYLLVDGTAIVSVTHGDAYPRSICLNYTTQGFFEDTAYSSWTKKNIFEFPGETGLNYTGANLGGIAASSTSYMTVGTYDSQSLYGYSNAFIIVTNKSTGESTTRYLTNYTDKFAGNPFIVKVNNDRFAIIWDVENTIYYTYVDGNGNSIDQIYSRPGVLSAVEPIVSGNSIVWCAMDKNAYWTDSIDKVNFYSIPVDPEAAKAEIGQFVDRLYTTCFNRQADTAGRQDWINRLFNAEVTGTGAASGFVFSQEFSNMNLCNEHYVDRLYMALMGREADPGGKANWVNQLNNGVTREAVFNGFAMSAEFKSICTTYGITVGSPIRIPSRGTTPSGTCTACQANRRGWMLSGGSWYYYGNNGQPVKNWQKIDNNWYYFGTSGKMVTGWQSIDGLWYYFSGSGKMITDWRQIDGNWYYFTASGKMATGWQLISGKWYYFSGNGKMITGWRQIDGVWYYFGTSGKMATGWQLVDNKWYYFSASGKMTTGWREIDGKYYYFYSGGAMASDTYIGTYYVDRNGVWIE